MPSRHAGGITRASACTANERRGASGAVGDEMAVRDDVVHVVAAAPAEGAAARDQPQPWKADVAVHLLGGERVLRDLLDRVDLEGQDGTVLAGDGDLVAMMEPLEPIEDRRPAARVHVPGDDGRPLLA